MQAKRSDDWTGGKEMSRSAIRVDLPQSNDGITAALRRAFKAAAVEPSCHDFEALLARLN
jgi:hypothetical protein